MPPVCSNSARRRSGTAMPNRRATPGRCHTGSMATLVTRTSPARVSTSPSGTSRPARIASFSSGMLMCARVTAMLGRTSWPAAISSPNISVVMCPHGSSETMAPGSLHCGKGPMAAAGRVLVRSGRCPALSCPAATATAR